jgi:hypothetical protein
MALIKATHPRAYETALRFFSDKHCQYCREALDEIDGKEIEAGKVLILRPDFNGAGVLTHFHIEVIPDPDPTPCNNFQRVQKARQEREKKRGEEEASVQTRADGLDATFKDAPAHPMSRADRLAKKMQKKEV